MGHSRGTNFTNNLKLILRALLPFKSCVKLEAGEGNWVVTYDDAQTYM